MAEKRLAVVTGAARGIGRAIVLELLKQGRIVAGLDINAEQLTELEEVSKTQAIPASQDASTSPTPKNSPRSSNRSPPSMAE